MDASESKLLQRARAGDAQAFARLVEAYWPRLHRWLYLLTRQEQLAEDLTQDTFLRAWRSLGELKDGLRFRAWLFSIARNCMLDGRRGPRGRAPEILAFDTASSARQPLEEIIGLETCGRIQSEFDRLPLLYRSALLLWTQEQLPYSEIAQALGTTEETARWRVCKARQMLQERLAGYLDQEPS